MKRILTAAVLLGTIATQPLIAQTDATTPLHLLKPDYPIPYGIPKQEEVIAVLNRVHGYLNGVTPPAFQNEKTGEIFTEASKIDPNTILQRGDFRIVSYEWGVTYAGMLAASEATGDPRFREYVDKRLAFIADSAAAFRKPSANYEEWEGRMPLRNLLNPRTLDDTGAMSAAMIKAARAGNKSELRPVFERGISHIMTGQHRLADGTLARNRPQPNTIWLDDLFMMRQGKAQNDIALYLPNADAYSHFTAGRVHLIDAERELVGEKIMPAIFEAGYNLDFFDDVILAEGRVSPGMLSLGASDHKIVVLPGIERIPLESIRKLDDFVRSGGILVATGRQPSAIPGFQTTETEQTELKQIAARLFSGSNPSVKFVANEEEFGPVLASLLQPDALITPSGKDFGVVHRKTKDADVYFVANTSNQTRKVGIAFRASGEPEIWDAITGRSTRAKAMNTNGSRSEIALNFEPYRSYVVVFSKKSSSPDPVEYSETGSSIDLNSDWSVSFGSQAPVQMPKLRSWSEGDATKYFSGTASYEKSVDISDEFLQSGKVVELSLGEPVELPVQPLRNGMQTWIDPPVREAAVIYVNGQRAGSLWSPPYRLDLTSLLRPGKNSLRIVVGNTALNYMAGHKLPDYKLLNLRYGERFQPQDMDKIQVLPSGLTGSVRLLSLK